MGEDAVKTGDELLVAPVDGDTDDNLAAVSADLLPGLDPPHSHEPIIAPGEAPPLDNRPIGRDYESGACPR